MAKRRKPKCYQSYRYNVCLGLTTRMGTLAVKCRRCKWLEKSQREEGQASNPAPFAAQDTPTL